MSARIFSPTERDAMLGRVLGMLESDERIEAAVITGSLGVGSADRWSDIDVACVVVGDASTEAVTTDWVCRLYRDLPVAHHYEVAFGTTLVHGFLLNDGLQVDLSFTPSADFSVWAPVRVAFDRTGSATKAAIAPESWTPTPDWATEAGFAWHDVLHACVAAIRGRGWQALFYLGRLRNRILALASERHGWDADEFAHVDDLPATERDPVYASLVTDLEPDSLLPAIDATTRAFLTELGRGDPALAERLDAPLRAFIDASIEATGRAGSGSAPPWPTS